MGTTSSATGSTSSSGSVTSGGSTSGADVTSTATGATSGDSQDGSGTASDDVCLELGQRRSECGGNFLPEEYAEVCDLALTQWSEAGEGCGSLAQEFFGCLVGADCDALGEYWMGNAIPDPCTQQFEALSQSCD